MISCELCLGIVRYLPKPSENLPKTFRYLPIGGGIWRDTDSTNSTTARLASNGYQRLPKHSNAYRSVTEWLTKNGVRESWSCREMVVALEWWNNVRRELLMISLRLTSV